MSNILQLLTDYYKRENILAKKFACKYKDKCYNGWNAEDITPAKSAFIGSEYEKKNRGFPRILFLSLDPGKEEKEPGESREEFLERLTPQGVRRSVQKGSLDDLKPGFPHWWWTHVLAAYLLRKISLNDALEGSEAIRPKLLEIRACFAHANTVKCSANFKDKSQAPKLFYRHCPKYLLEEVKILAPDVLITQGNDAAYYASTEFGFKGPLGQSKFTDEKLNEQDLLWIQSYHPRAKSRYKNRWALQQEQWKEWKKKIDADYWPYQRSS